MSPGALAPLPAAILLAASTLVQGLDHVAIAVHDLESAAARYERLGFTLKPGTPHDNGLRNRHVKFADGTELELITASEARDALTAEYREHLAEGEGPAFLALFAPDLDALAAALGDRAVRAPRRRASFRSHRPARRRRAFRA